jgi:hypothetical protein
VAELCAPLTRRLLDRFIEPLCVSALNTPAAAASGAVFLRVLRDALFGAPGSSNLLLPTKDLSALFPQAAADWLRQQGPHRPPGPSRAKPHARHARPGGPLVGRRRAF